MIKVKDTVGSDTDWFPYLRPLARFGSCVFGVTFLLHFPVPGVRLFPKEPRLVVISAFPIAVAVCGFRRIARGGCVFRRML